MNTTKKLLPFICILCMLSCYKDYSLTEEEQFEVLKDQIIVIHRPGHITKSGSELKISSGSNNVILESVEYSYDGIDWESGYVDKEANTINELESKKDFLAIIEKIALFNEKKEFIDSIQEGHIVLPNNFISKIILDSMKLRNGDDFSQIKYKRPLLAPKPKLDAFLVKKADLALRSISRYKRYINVKNDIGKFELYVHNIDTNYNTSKSGLLNDFNFVMQPIEFDGKKYNIVVSTINAIDFGSGIIK